jgi:DNA-binding NarL/FixJ family response regulator
MVSILVLEDNKILLRRMLAILQKWDKANRVVGVGTNAECANQLKSEKFDVFLADLNLPDGQGSTSIKLYKETNPSGICIVFSALIDSVRILDALKLGAVGYVQKDDSSLEYIQSIEMAIRGSSPMSPMIAREIINSLHKEDTSSLKVKLTSEILSPREMEVIDLISKGLANEEISFVLGISINTVPVHIRNIYKKLHARNRAGAIYQARLFGLI